ncbi:MAG: UDP-3-O-(3-hydroxymyristoyl)glucosamine N-acyltransferase [Deltaproteobacteria bacterium]|jgi:UDP-3-O-[3-hydroxymyristoyl] glucosamine N-acyltransferase|nr:UDP-3-O-(3-hydroxymyristoyl)glucosamine N-acyltransferase [Deltaproteobacteria bacterium]
MIALPAPAPLAQLLQEAEFSLKAQLAPHAAVWPAPLYEVRGAPETLVKALAAAGEPDLEGALTFAAEAKFLAPALASGASAIIVPQNLALPEKAPAAWVACAEPRLLFAAVLNVAEKRLRPALPAGEPFFRDRESVSLGRGARIGPLSYVGARVTVGDGTVIGPQVYVGDDCQIGRDCLIHPGAILRWRTRLGDRVIIHAGAVLGEDGFGYTQIPIPASGRLIHYKNAHLGGVLIGDDVEIGALSCVDRGLVADTVIKEGSKLDNLVQVGHNCEIGRDCVVVSQAGAAGHSRVGDRAFILGQAGITHGGVVGADAIVTGQTGVTGHIPPGKRAWSGTPALPHEEDLKTQALARRYLPRWRRFVEAFKKSATFQELQELFFNSKDRGSPS